MDKKEITAKDVAEKIEGVWLPGNYWPMERRTVLCFKMASIGR